MESSRDLIYEKRFLERIKFNLIQKYSWRTIQDLKIETWNELETLSVRFGLELFGEQLKDTIIKYPLNWWEAFKERWFFKWLLKRYPIKYKKIKLEVKVLYPDFVFPSDLKQIEYIKYDEKIVNG